mgnify:CR=1 FL=1
MALKEKSETTQQTGENLDNGRSKHSLVKDGYEQLAALYDVSNQFSQIYDENELYNAIPKLLTNSLDFDRASFLLSNKKHLVLRAFCFEKNAPNEALAFMKRVQESQLPPPEPFETSFGENRTVFIPNPKRDPNFPEEARAMHNKALVITPIRIKNKPIGLIAANMQHHDREMDQNDVTRFEMFANLVGHAVESVRAYQTLEKKVKARTEALATANKTLKAKAEELEETTFSLGRANIELLATQEKLVEKNTMMEKLVLELSKSEERFRNLVENANDIIYTISSEGDVLYISPNILDHAGYSVQEMTGASFLSYIHPDDLGKAKSFIRQIVTSAQNGRGPEYRFKHAGGGWRWYHTSASPLKDDEGKVIGLIGITHDIHEEKEAHDALEEKNRALQEAQSQLVQSEKMASLGNLVAGIAHEINTPVGAISSMHKTSMQAQQKLLGIFRKDHPEAFETNKMLQRMIKIIDDANRVIGSGSERVIKIVKRLRSFARLDEAELKDADIHEGLEDTLTLIHHEIKHKVELHRDFAAIPKIACFPGKLNQVFLNLLVNATQAIGEKGEITIQTRSENGKVKIQFSDTGKGIASENLNKVFDPGFTTKGVGVGTGLGLSICYRIMQEHRGQISVESKLGSGTTFTLTLPTDLDKILESEGVIT